MPEMDLSRRKPDLSDRQQSASSLWTRFSPCSTPSFSWHWNQATNTISNLIARSPTSPCLQIILQAGSTIQHFIYFFLVSGRQKLFAHVTQAVCGTPAQGRGAVRTAAASQE